MSAQADALAVFDAWSSERRVHVEGDVAWVAAAGEAGSQRPGGPRSTIPYRVLAVLVGRDGVWRLHTYCGGEPRTEGDAGTVA